jgi:hypothetical protein
MSIETKTNILLPFFVCPYNAFNICEKGNSIRSWIIEHLFMTKMVKEFSCCVFDPLALKYA